MLDKRTMLRTFVSNRPLNKRWTKSTLIFLEYCHHDAMIANRAKSRHLQQVCNNSFFHQDQLSFVKNCKNNSV
jgi:hypothetical protein